MSEIYAGIEWFKLHNSSFQKAIQNLHEKEKVCLSGYTSIKGNTETNGLLKLCSQDRIDFDNYFSKYSEVYAEKGKEICQNYLRERVNELGQLSLRELQFFNSKCLKLYFSDFKEFESNVMKKLDSLLNKYSIENL